MAASRACTGGSSQRFLEYVDASTQVVLRLEQRHHVEHRRLAVRRDRRELEHGRDVGGRCREADDVAAARVDAVFVLQPRHRANGLEHLVGHRRHVAAGGEFGAGAARVHAAVLANLEFGEVETKGARLPDEVLELTERQPMRTGPRERLLHEQRAARSIHRDAGSRRPRRAAAPRDGLRCRARRVGAARRARATRGRRSTRGGRAAHRRSPHSSSALGGVVAASAVSVRPMRVAARSRASST